VEMRGVERAEALNTTFLTPLAKDYDLVWFSYFRFVFIFLPVFNSPHSP